VDERRITESFKPEYKDEEAGRRMRMQPGEIRTERLRQDYGCSIFACRERERERERGGRGRAVDLAETNEGSSNSMKREEKIDGR